MNIKFTGMIKLPYDHKTRQKTPYEIIKAPEFLAPHSVVAVCVIFSLFSKLTIPNNNLVKENSARNSRWLVYS